jgi:hypothetical protein
MGAESFGAMGHGKTAQEAFLQARSEAQYEHGHGGYSGTIAEKHSFVEINPKMEAARVVAKLIERRATMTVANQKKAIARRAVLQAIDNSGAYFSRDQEEELDALVMYAPLTTDPVRLAEERTRLTKKIALARRGDPMTIASEIEEHRFDKHGPAGCVKVKSGEYFFWGVASS